MQLLPFQVPTEMVLAAIEGPQPRGLRARAASEAIGSIPTNSTTGAAATVTFNDDLEALDEEEEEAAAFGQNLYSIHQLLSTTDRDDGALDESLSPRSRYRKSARGNSSTNSIVGSARKLNHRIALRATPSVAPGSIFDEEAVLLRAGIDLAQPSAKSVAAYARYVKADSGHARLDDCSGMYDAVWRSWRAPVGEATDEKSLRQFVDAIATPVRTLPARPCGCGGWY